MTTTQSGKLASAFDAAQESIDAALGGTGKQTYRITPAHDASVMCHFTIETGAEPIKFSVRRIEYNPPSHAEAYDKWLRERIEEGKAEGGTPVTAREMILKQLEMLIPKTTYKRVEKLTMGELEQIFEHWRAASIPAKDQ